MYIFELMVKLFKEKNKKNYKPSGSPESEYEECNHVFLPIDSTCETLACSKCGLIVKNDSSQYKPKNPFL